MDNNAALTEAMEKYLQSKDPKYYLADYNVASAKVIVFEDCPKVADIKGGYPASALSTYNGIELFDEKIDLEEKGIGVAYISNVPLFPTDEDTWKLVGPMEGTRLEPHPTSEYLREQFGEKMEKIILSDNIRLIVYKLEIFKRYYDDFVASADSETVKALRDKLSAGVLKILLFPQYRIDMIKKFEKTYNDFKSAFDDSIK